MESLELMRLLDEIAKLRKEIKLLQSSLLAPTDSYSSPVIAELATSLAKAQGEYKPVGFNRENPYFKTGYTDLNGIIKAVRGALSKNGLSFVQQTRISSDGITMLHSILLHSSGQWIESRSRIIPPKNDAQAYGSTLSHQKRYAAMSLLNITVDHDFSDDDAEIAMMESRDIIAKGTSLNRKYNPREQSYEPITKEQLEELEYELTEQPDIAEQILEGMKIQSLADLPKSKFLLSVNRIREIKNIRSGKK